MSAFEISIVYAEPNRCIQRALSVVPGMTIAMALEQSGILAEIDATLTPTNLGMLKVAILGVLKDPQAPLSPGDRVALTRPLQCDPKQVRRAHAKSQRRT